MLKPTLCLLAVLTLLPFPAAAKTATETQIDQGFTCLGIIWEAASYEDRLETGYSDTAMEDAVRVWSTWIENLGGYVPEDGVSNDVIDAASMRFAADPKAGQAELDRCMQQQPR